MVWFALGILALLGLIALYDIFQKKHAILRNFPIIGHFRYFLESIGPEIRQYIVANNTEERPFNRDQRRWIYSTAKLQNEQFAFGTEKEVELASNYMVFQHSGFAFDGSKYESLPSNSTLYPIPCAKVLGGYRQRKKAYRPRSVVNISGMSFGSLSGAAVEALNKGAKIAHCFQSTGEGGISKYHNNGGNLIWNIGSGYFGCRNADGTFSLERFKETVERYPSIKAIELKLSQGAKPGLGGVLPGSKVNIEIAEARGVPVGVTCVSPSRHSAFSNVDELLDFVELLADVSGLPVGIKSAVGSMDFWEELATLIKTTGRAVDFINIDGGEGGTGAAPLVFADHVSLPFKLGFTKVYKVFARENLQDHIVFMGAGKLGLPESAIFAMSMGCDMINVAREAMFAIGCIQAQKCHTNHCPTGVATQNKWLVRGLDPHSKSHRVANYIIGLRKQILKTSWACGVIHPSLLKPSNISILDGKFGEMPADQLFGYEEHWGTPSEADRAEIIRIMSEDFSP